MSSININMHWLNQIQFNKKDVDFEVVAVVNGEDTTKHKLKTGSVYKFSQHNNIVSWEEADLPGERWELFSIQPTLKGQVVSLSDKGLDGATGIVGIDDIRPNQSNQYGCRLSQQAFAYAEVLSNKLKFYTSEEPVESFIEFKDESAQAFRHTIETE